MRYFILIIATSLLLSGCIGKIDTSVHMSTTKMQNGVPLRMPQNYNAAITESGQAVITRTFVIFMNQDELTQLAMSDGVTDKALSRNQKSVSAQQLHKVKDVLDVHKGLHIGKRNDIKQKSSYFMNESQDNIKAYSHVLGLDILSSCEIKINETLMSGHEGTVFCTSTVPYQFIQLNGGNLLGNNEKHPVIVDKGYVNGMSKRYFKMEQDDNGNMVITDGGGLFKKGKYFSSEKYQKFQPQSLLDEAFCNANLELLKKLTKNLPLNVTVDSFMGGVVRFNHKGEKDGVQLGQLFTIYSVDTKFAKPIGLAKVYSTLPHMAELKVVSWSDNSLVKKDIQRFKQDAAGIFRAVSMGLSDDYVKEQQTGGMFTCGLN